MSAPKTAAEAREAFFRAHGLRDELRAQRDAGDRSPGLLAALRRASVRVSTVTRTLARAALRKAEGGTT